MAKQLTTTKSPRIREIDNNLRLRRSTKHPAGVTFRTSSSSPSNTGSFSFKPHIQTRKIHHLDTSISEEDSQKKWQVLTEADNAPWLAAWEQAAGAWGWRPRYHGWRDVDHQQRGLSAATWEERKRDHQVAAGNGQAEAGGEFQGGAVARRAALSPVAVLGAVTAWEEKQEAAMRPSARRPI